MDDADLRLDGNAAAGLLGEVFPFEMTVARTTCGHCGMVEPVGNVLVYMQAPGVVFRCIHCGGVQIRVVRGRGRFYVDLSGVRCMQIPEAADRTE
ncbi:MAG: DUF6510 family protein [Actinomycetota bacterium]